MIRCFKAKHPVLISVSLIDMHVRKFHLASKSLTRSASHRSQRSQVAGKSLENDLHPIAPENSNVNFLGIEGDEGVITVTSKVSYLQEKTSTKNMREKFYKTSYGIIRYDTDNKLKFHGQYGKRDDFVFPHGSNDISEVSRNISEMTPKTLDELCDNYKESSSVNAENKSELLCENSSNEVRKENISKESGEVSFIDQFYFETISGDVEKKNSLPNKHSTDELSYLDKKYFGYCIESENQNLSQGPSENISLKDELNLKINSDIKDDTVNNPSFTSSTDDFNLMYKNYFGESNVPKIQKLHHMEEISHNTVLFNSSNPESNHENLSTKSTEENKAIIFTSNFEEGRKCNSNSSIKDVFDSVLQSNVKVNESFDRNEIKIKNSDCDLNVKPLNSKILESDNELNLDTVVENDLPLNGKQPLSDWKTKINLDSNRSSHVVKSNFLKLTKPSLSGKCTNDSVISSEECTNADNVRTAYDFVRNLHKQLEVPVQNVKKDGNKLFDMKLDSKGFRILKDQVKDLSHFTQDEILSILKQSILYQDDNLLILNKPYSLVIHDSQTTKLPGLSSFLEDLAKEIDGKKFNSKLVTVHRLDKETTGCLLIARNETMAQNLQSLFAQRKIIKKYWVVTSKVPDPPEGLIDIPISEGSVNNKKRMVLHPEIPKDIAYRNHSSKGKKALTSYKVLSESGNAALVEATPITGIKHQIRVHFGFGLSCPIIGDHKYSHLDKLAPQKLPSDILQRLHVRQSKVRYIPLHIHAKSVTVPGYFEDRDLYVQAPLPYHIKENLKRLKFKKK